MTSRVLRDMPRDMDPQPEEATVFPPDSEGFDMGQMLQQAQRMQEQLMSTQRELAEAEVTGTAGGGLVSATVTGAGDLTNLQIDPSVVDPEDVDTLTDLIIAAVRDGRAEIQRRADEQLGSIDADVAGLLGGAGGQESPLAGLFGGGSAGALPDTDEARDDEGPGGPSSGRES